MKVLTTKEVEGHLDAVCEKVSHGEVVFLRTSVGNVVELKPVFVPPTAKELQGCYDDTEWAAFENNCGKASN